MTRERISWSGSSLAQGTGDQPSLCLLAGNFFGQIIKFAHTIYVSAGNYGQIKFVHLSWRETMVKCQVKFAPSHSDRVDRL